RYDAEALYFDESVRNAKRKQFESNALEIVYPAYTTTLKHLRYKALDDFKTKLGSSLNNGEGFASSCRTWTESIMLNFDIEAADASVRQANWDDASKARYKLRCDIDSHALAVCNEKLLEIATNSKVILLSVQPPSNFFSHFSSPSA
ncbi:protein root hair defective 3, partial [Trifolium pratense]